MTVHTRHAQVDRALAPSPLYAGCLETEIPRAHLGERGIGAELAASIVADELLLDGNARLNLATFCATVGEPVIDALAAGTARVNITNQDEYPASVEIERRLCAIVANLWHAPADYAAVATTGSSEAIQLAVLAARQRYRERGGTGTPNLVYSAAAHPCWDKACRYFDVEPRRLPIPTTPGAPALDPAVVRAAIDEDTIAVAATLGYPSTGILDDVHGLAQMLDRLHRDTGLDVGLHVDAASGGFTVPFSHPELVWDFGLERVVSINASGHKYAGAPLGLGFVAWRHDELLPDHLCFDVNLLGGQPVKSFSLTFSRPAAPIIAAYTTMLRLGREGYTSLVAHEHEVAALVAEAVVRHGFTLWGDGRQLPLVAFSLPVASRRSWGLEHLSAKLREKGWQLPVYALPPGAEDVLVARVTCRAGLSADLAHRLIADLDAAVAALDAHEGGHPDAPIEGFHQA
ncbi:glutamate decarboxylase [Actinospica durhamensis]|uniref:Glutamate decarboxylase n=1 Tax=Actinospica durhamensis TaxID=1508375 RepID=A0A941ER30_9ACTN|nr:glutamate decarboxylase [Actinospica durhamensis]MBR7835885.1 glutamate decarboxylase [Actinospica durhamensis]